MMKQPNENKLTLRKNDQIQVIAGREKGKTGKIISINRGPMQVLVEKINLLKRHTKPTQGNPSGGILEKEAPLHYSNVQLFCAKCNRGVRYGIKIGAAAKGAPTKKTRVCKKCGSSLESTVAK